MLLFLDTETTGLPNNRLSSYDTVLKWPRLVEVAWIECHEEGTVVSEYNQIIKPDGFVIPKQASAIHGITTEKAMKNGIQLHEVLMQLFTVIGRCSVIIGHNVEFDTKIIEMEFLRTGLLKDHYPKLFGRQVCTMKSATKLYGIRSGYGRLKYPTLSELYLKLFGECFEHNHNALSDARACKKCFFELKKRGVL